MASLSDLTVISKDEAKQVKTYRDGDIAALSIKGKSRLFGFSSLEDAVVDTDNIIKITSGGALISFEYATASTFNGQADVMTLYSGAETLNIDFSKFKAPLEVLVHYDDNYANYLFSTTRKFSGADSIIEFAVTSGYLTDLSNNIGAIGLPVAQVLAAQNTNGFLDGKIFTDITNKVLKYWQGTTIKDFDSSYDPTKTKIDVFENATKILTGSDGQVVTLESGNLVLKDGLDPSNTSINSFKNATKILTGNNGDIVTLEGGELVLKNSTMQQSLVNSSNPKLPANGRHINIDFATSAQDENIFTLGGDAGRTDVLTSHVSGLVSIMISSVVTTTNPQGVSLLIELIQTSKTDKTRLGSIYYRYFVYSGARDHHFGLELPLMEITKDSTWIVRITDSVSTGSDTDLNGVQLNAQYIQV